MALVVKVIRPAPSVIGAPFLEGPMKIQFYHRNTTDGFTAAIVPPNAEELLSLLSDPTKTIKFSTGVATLHPADQYNKKIGKELSSQRLVEQEFNVEMLTYYSDIDKYFFVLYSEDVRIAMNLKRNHVNVRVFEVEVL